MRPRPDAAENAYADAMAAHDAYLASMRPRPDAAENRRACCSGDYWPPGFNEAAARCRGKLDCPSFYDERMRASMRPRPDAAENLEGALMQLSTRIRFNEAAARCRGKLTRQDDILAAVRQLQ